MSAQSCVCVSSTCPPCMGRCGCKFQKSESGLALGAIIMVAVLAIGILLRRCRRGTRKLEHGL